MSSKRYGGLGRGLGALIPTSGGTAGTVDTIDTDDVVEPVDSPAPPTVPAVPTAAAPEVTVVPPTSTPPAEPAPVATFTSPVPPVVPAADVASTTAAPPTDADGPLPVPGARFAEIAIDDIAANPKQPRQVFDEDALAELAHSISEFGVLQPVVVRVNSANTNGTGVGYELIMGERRLRAAQVAGLSAIPAIIRDTADDAMLRDALLENIHRAALNPLEEAAAYQQLLEEFGTTHEELATRIGRSRSQVSNTIRLLNLPVAVQRRVAAGVLSAGHARALLGLTDKDKQDELAARIVAEGLSVRATEELVALAAREQPDTRTARARTTPRITAPGINDLADKLADAFETRVRVELGRRKGKITVEFASVDDLERIVALMAPKLATRPVD